MLGVTRLRFVALLVLISMQFLALPGHSAGAQDVVPSTIQVSGAGKYIVRLKPTSGVSVASISATYEAMSGVSISQTYTHVFKGFAGEFTNAATNALVSDPNVLSVTPDYAVHASAQTTPIGILRIDDEINPTVAGNGSGSVSVDVAVLDTGVYQHSDLTISGGKDCVYDASPYSDVNGHGTHVSGTIAAKDNGDGVVGVAPGARIWAVKVLGDDGGGEFSDVICGLDYVRSKASTIEVINMSLGGNVGNLGSCAADPFHEAVCDVVDAGVTVVVAAGNDFIDTSTVAPAQFSEVITVSAIADFDGLPGGLTGDGTCSFNFVNYFQPDDAFTCFSNFGAAVDIAAPGFLILSTATGGGTTTLSGTSMASPHVAGAAGLILAQQGDMTPSQVRTRLRLTAQPGPLEQDFDPNKEPMLNVAFLGTGKIVSPTSGKVGEEIQVRIGDFTPYTRAIFRFNGTYMGGDDVDTEGRASRNFVIPAAVNGSYEISVSNGNKTVKKNITINPSIVLSTTSGPVGTNVTVTFGGFDNGEVVDVIFDTGPGDPVVINNKTLNSKGGGSASFNVPASTNAKHRVQSDGNKGSEPHAYFTTKASAYLSSGTPQPGNNVTVQYRGYEGGEDVVIRFDTQSGTVVNTPVETASSSGSGSDTATIPNSASNGTHYLWVMGSDGTSFRITLTVTGAGLPQPTPTATATATSTPEPTDTAVPTEVPPTETPTEVPTDVPTEIPTEVPTDVPTNTPTEVPSDTPTEVPTETPTEIPTEVPTDTPTEAPTDTPTPEV